MLFNSSAFIGLLLVTLILFYLPVFRGLQTYTLIAASLFFYAYGQPVLVLLLLVSILINATSSYRVLNTVNPKSRKNWAIAGVTLNLAVLFFFKYGPLAIRTFGIDTHDPQSIGHFLVNIPLPIGISFFTFQGISLVVDVFRQQRGGVQLIKHKDVWHHFVDTAFFKAFFPQLVAGPIVKAHDFYPQIRPKQFGTIAWDSACRALVVGYFLKMVIADNLKDLTFWIAYPYFQTLSTATLLTMLFGYSMQIFADFAGYSLIAIGTARLFGYELMENFNFPYVAQSLSEFWRRWHISLSTWLREYLYFPLGGNRKGEARTYLNLIIVMFLGGLWHGAAWSYAIWGIYHGGGLVVERLWQKFTKRPVQEKRSFSLLRAAGVFAFVTAGWLLFKLPNFAHVVAYVRTCFANRFVASDARLISFILCYSAPVVAYHALYLCHRRFDRLRSTNFYPVIYGACLFGLIVNSGSPGAFIYFQF